MEKGTDSPLHKKFKGNQTMPEPPAVPARNSGRSSNGVPARKELQMAAPDPASLQTDAPPSWFLDFEKRQRKEFEVLLDAKLRELIAKVAEHADKIESLHFENQSLKDSVKCLKEQNSRIEAKLDDLENRHRRQNVVLFGLQESGRKEDCLQVVGDFFRWAEVQKDDIDKIERCHRTPTSPTGHAGRPRRIHIFFGSYMAKERVRKAVIAHLKKANSMYNDHQVSIAEDLSKKVLDLRKEKRPIFKRLKNEGKRPFFIYPARIGYRDAVSGKLTIVEE